MDSEGTFYGRFPYLDDAPHLANHRWHSGLCRRHDDLHGDGEVSMGYQMQEPGMVRLEYINLLFPSQLS